jgi:hypothetical protein
MYYSGMAQPKDPPLSIRLPLETLAELKAEAARREVTVNALIVRAVRKELGQRSDEEVAKPRPALSINRIAAAPKPHVNRLKTVWIAP